MEKLTWEERVKAFLKGGDDAKLVRFKARLIKYFKNQIRMRTDSIDSLKEKVTDKKDELKEATMNVNLEEINQSEKLDTYVPAFVAKVNTLRKEVKALEDEIVANEKEIETLKANEALIFS